MRVRALVAWNLRRLRVARQLTQEALGLLGDFEPSYVGRIERAGENPTVDTLETLANALDAPVSEFFVIPEPGSERPGTMRRGRKPRQPAPRADER